MVALDPEVREYVMYFFLQDLRQVHSYSKGRSGSSLNLICNRIRIRLKKRNWTEDLLNKFCVDRNMMYSIANELHLENKISFFTKTKRSGFLGLNKTQTNYFQITTSGLNYIKNNNIPPKPLPNVL